MLANVIHALGAAVGESEAGVLVRAGVIGAILGLRKPAQIAAELETNEAARWFVDAPRGGLEPESLATAMKVMASDATAQWFLPLLDAVVVFGSANNKRPKPKGQAERELRERASRAAEQWGLTVRQTDVLRELAYGRTNKEIGAKLGLAPGTIELHITVVLEKSGAPNRATLLARLALEF